MKRENTHIFCDSSPKSVARLLPRPGVAASNTQAVPSSHMAANRILEGRCMVMFDE